MKSPSEKLFKLIQSMSANEKNYFKRQTAAHNRKADNQYLDLFDAIAKQKEYNETTLLKKFKDRTFAKQFASMKRYLYKVLMQTLVDLYESKDIVSEIHKMRSEAKVLIERGLITEGLQIFKKARNKAAHWELQTLELSLLLEENKHAINFKDHNAPEIQAFYKEFKVLTATLSNMGDYMQLYDSFLYWEKRERSLRDQDALEKLESIIQSSEVQTLRTETAFLSKLHYHSIHERYAMLKGDDPQILNCKAALFKLYEDHPHMKEVDETNYFMVCLNYLNILYRLKEFRLLKKELIKFEQISFKNKEIMPYYFSRISNIKLCYCEISGNFKDFKIIVNKVSAEYLNPSHELSTLEWRLLFYNIVKLYIIQGKYELAQNWIIKLLELPKTNQQSDLQHFAHLLQILIHYQLGDVFLIDYLNTTIKRRLNQKNRLYTYEKLFLDLFQKLIHTPNSKRTRILKKYYNKCDQFFQNKSELSNKEYFDLTLWIKATLEDTSMLNLIQKDRMTTI